MFYLDIFNTIKEICVYCNEACEVKIIESKDFTNTEEFFKQSQYKGIKYVDISCQFSLNEQTETYLLRMFYKLAKNKPIEILEVKIEKNKVNLTMRLYGT